MREGQARTVARDEVNVDLPADQCSMIMSNLRTLVNGTQV